MFPSPLDLVSAAASLLPLAVELFGCSHDASFFLFKVLVALDVVLGSLYGLVGFCFFLLDLAASLREVVWVQVWSEDVEGVFSCREEQGSIDGVESKLFHVVLALVKEHKLWWNI